jgi:hypothetical protein
MTLVGGFRLKSNYGDDWKKHAHELLTEAPEPPDDAAPPSS